MFIRYAITPLLKKFIILAPTNKKTVAGSTGKVGTGLIGKPSSQIGKSSSFGSSSKASNIFTPGKLSGSDRTASFFGASTKSSHFGVSNKDSYFGASNKDNYFGASAKSTKATSNFPESNAKSSSSPKAINVQEPSAKYSNALASPVKTYSASISSAKPDSYSLSSSKNSSILGSTEKYSNVLGSSTKKDSKSFFGGNSESVKNNIVLGSAGKTSNSLGTPVKYESKPTLGSKIESSSLAISKNTSVTGSAGQKSNNLGPVKNESKSTLGTNLISGAKPTSVLGSSGTSSNSAGKKVGMLSSTGIAANVLLSSGTNKNSPSSYSNTASTTNKNYAMSSNNKSPNIIQPNGPNTNHLGSSGKYNAFNSSVKNDGMFGTAGKATNVLMPSGKNYISPKYDDKSAKLLASPSRSSNIHDPNKTYPSFMNLKEKKPATMKFGLIWLPLRRRNKKKDAVHNAHNYENYNRSPSMYNFMSGDSPDYQSQTKKEEETKLVSEQAKLTSVAVNTGITAASIDMPPDGSGPANLEEKQEFIRHDTEESKEAAGDTNENNKIDKDYLENNDNFANPPEKKWDNEKQGDKVDSVYLRPPPSHKARSSASTNEEEDCGIKCLYYTLQCCDCVLM